MTKKVKAKKNQLLGIALLLFSTIGFAQHSKQLSKEETLKLLKEHLVSEDHASEFGKVVIQDAGRMKPINTFSSELLRKVSKSDTYKGLNSDEAIEAVRKVRGPRAVESKIQEEFVKSIQFK